MKNLLLTILILLPFCVFGQQLPGRSVFSETNFLWNPAMTAQGHFWEAGTNYRQSWVGFEDAPRTASINMQYPFLKEKMALGGFFMHDDVSPVKTNTFALTYAYKLHLGGRKSHSQLSIGLMAMMNHYLVSGFGIVANDADDDFLPIPENNQLAPNFGFGVLYSNNGGKNFDKSYFYAGAGVNQTLSRDLIFKEFGSLSNFKRAFHANMILGYHSISGDYFIDPVIWVNYSAPNLTDANFSLKLEKRNVFWAGINLSFTQTLSMQIGYILKGITKDGTVRVGLAGSYHLGSFSKARGIGYEFYAAYRFELGKK